MKIAIVVYEKATLDTLKSLDYYALKNVSDVEIVTVNGEHYAKYLLV